MAYFRGEDSLRFDGPSESAGENDWCNKHWNVMSGEEQLRMNKK